MATLRPTFLPKLLSPAALALAVVLAVPALSVRAAAQAAKAPAAEAPAKTVAVHDDWVVRCSDQATGRICEATQTLQTTDQSGVLAHVAVRAEKDKPAYLVVLVPPGVWLPANVTFTVKDGPTHTLTYKRCGAHCVASLELKADDIAALKASAGSGELSFETGSRQQVILPLSFKGLGAALVAALNKE